MLQQTFVRVRNLQPGDALPHSDSEMVAILLGLPARGVLSEERFSYLLEVVERMGQQRVEPIRGYAFQAG